MQVWLDTARLQLRLLTLDDATNLYELYTDATVMQFISRTPVAFAEIAESLLPHYISRYERSPVYGVFAACERTSGSFLGCFALGYSDAADLSTLELGYRLRRDAWGQGYATEGAHALLERGFSDPRVRRIWAQTMAVNTRSRRVMEKIGLRFVRAFHLEWDDPLPGVEQGEVEYALTRQQWEEQR